MNWQNPSSALLHSVSLSLQREAGREVLTDGCSVLWLLLQFWMGHHSGKHRERERERERRAHREDKRQIIFCSALTTTLICHICNLNIVLSPALRIQSSSAQMSNWMCCQTQESVAIMRQMISSALSVHLVLPSRLLSHLSLLTHHKHTKMKRFSWRFAQENRWKACWIHSPNLSLISLVFCTVKKKKRNQEI